MSTADTDDGGVVTGTVTYADTGEPASGVRVEVTDDDLFFDDSLGSATTDEEGRYRIEYTYEDYSDVFEGRPDVFVEVFDQEERRLTTTQDAVTREAGPEETIHVEVPGSGPGEEPPDEPEPPTEPTGPTKTLSGYPLERDAYEELEPDGVLEIAEAVRQADPPEEAIRRLTALNEDLGMMLRGPSMSLTPVVRTLTDIVIEKDWDREVLLELEEVLGRAELAGFSTYSCGKFEIDYDTSGSAAVPSDDMNDDIEMPGSGATIGSTGDNGVPDYVERLCFWLNRAYNAFTSSPFSLDKPNSGGTIPVEVVDTTSAGYVLNGTIYMGNDLPDDFLGWVAVHELMHVFQGEYGSLGASGTWASGMTEGGAVLAEDTVIDAINRYAAEAADFQNREGSLYAPEKSLNSLSYKLSTFLKYISEQQSPRVRPGDEPQIGVDTYRELLETFDSKGYTTSAFEDAIHDQPWYRRFHSFDYLDPAQKDLMNGETVLGNFWLACYCKDFGVDVPDRRFDFMEDEETSLADEIEPLGISPQNYQEMESVDLTKDVTLSAGDTITLASGGSQVDAFAARFYRITVDSSVDTVEIDFDTPSGSSLGDPIVQAVLAEPDGSGGQTVRDIYRTDREDWTRTIANERDGTKLDHVTVVVAGSDNGGQFSLTSKAVSATPDVTMTRWHTRAGEHYEIDPFGWSWTWTSPDVWVDNDGNGTADDEVYFNQNNDLVLRLRNQGNADASGVSVQLWYQDASSGLSASAWQPVRDASGSVQTLSGVSIPADTVSEHTVKWAPNPSGGSNHFCVRAVINAPNDPNETDKRVLSNFGNVVSGGPFVDLEWLRRQLREDLTQQIEVVPRTYGRYQVSEMDLERIERAQVDGERLEQLRLTRREAETVRADEDREDVRPVPELSRRIDATDIELEYPANGDWREKLTWSVCACGNSVREVPRAPDPRGHYPTDPAALPPGVEEADLVTVTQTEEGRVAGGFTWAIREE